MIKIGFFDSGIGGLTVLQQAMVRYPHAHYVYFADTDNVPYGTKGKKDIQKLVNEAVAFIMDLKVDILVIACNTATSTSIAELRKKYKCPIIGMEPAVKPAILMSGKKKKRILVAATKLTLKQKKLKDLIHDLGAKDKVDRLSLQKLVMYAEKKKWATKKVRQYLSKKLGNIDWEKYGALVLGCTHFLYYKNLIRDYVPDGVEIIDGNVGTVNRLMYYLKKMDSEQGEPSLSYYESGKKKKVKKILPYMDLVSKISISESDS